MMKAIILSFLGLSLYFNLAQSQDLLKEMYRKISPRKKNIYLDKGIFFSKVEKAPSKLKAVRHSFNSGNGYERVVLDFTSKKLPKIYGYISGNEKKVYFDLFNTDVSTNLGSFGNSKYVKKLNFYKYSDESTSIEIDFKDNVSVDIFYLESAKIPARLVLDVKSN